VAPAVVTAVASAWRGACDRFCYPASMILRRASLPLSALLFACGGSSGDDGGTASTGPGAGDTGTGAVVTGGETGGPESTGETGGTGDEPTTAGSSSTGEGPPPAPEQFWLLEDIVFYDGYAGLVDEPVPEGVIRHRNDLVATRMSDEDLGRIQNTLRVGVIVGALCDNYDRIGGVNLALVPKGADTYVPAEVDRIEVARFITPFMNMNKDPKEVPYEWQADHIVPILKDPELLAEYDIWFELAIFGVPYAAQTEVPGCAGRIDTQLGSLGFYSSSSQPAPAWTTLIPLAISEDFNNYAEGASDMVGTTRKTINFELPADTARAQVVFITSNHGANQGGEEYIRRQHYMYIDGHLAMQYRPGRDTCEPFRKYNTQGNGIYGPSPMSDAAWQSFSNWCPGDVIDTRIFTWGPVKAGPHEFVIEVPDATFAGMQGNFPFSLFVQAE
jgi:hypothetical protein